MKIIPISTNLLCFSVFDKNLILVQLFIGRRSWYIKKTSCTPYLNKNIIIKITTQQHDVKFQSAFSLCLFIYIYMCLPRQWWQHNLLFYSDNQKSVSEFLSLSAIGCCGSRDPAKILC